MINKKMFLLLCFLGFLACKEQEVEDPTEAITAIENGLINAIQIYGLPVEKFNILDRMKDRKVPGVSLAVIKNGKIAWAKAYGIANAKDSSKINTETLFQAGSISKPIAALAALQLVQQGKIDLDTSVNSYLQDWKLNEAAYQLQQKVTLRRLLTHTAGVTVHGFPGYSQMDKFPSITDVLNGLGNTDKISVDTIPGSIWRYSGGGYTIMEKLIEDVSGMPLEQYAARFIFPILAMNRSTFEQPLTEKWHDNASAAFDTDGEMIQGKWHNYPEQAAAGLWTTPSDLANYCIQIQEIMQGKADGVLSKDIVAQMLTMDKNGWGLGPSLEGNTDSLRFGHGGKNAGFTNNMTAWLHQGNGLIIMTNGDNGWTIIDELQRAVSATYGWPYSDPRTIDVVDISESELNALIGQYKYAGDRPGLDNYIVELTVEDNTLHVINEQEGSKQKMLPLSSLDFMDVENGDQMAFTLGAQLNEISFFWNGAFEFKKVNESR